MPLSFPAIAAVMIRYTGPDLLGLANIDHLP